MSATAYADMTAAQALESLQFILAGLHSHPTDGTTESSDTTAALAALCDLAAHLRSDTTVTDGNGVTHLVEALLELGTPLRDDQARGIAAACHALGVSAAALQQLDATQPPPTSPGSHDVSVRDD